MDKWAKIRRRVLVDGQSKRSVCQEFEIHWDTLIKILGHSEPPGYRHGQPPPQAKIGPFLGVIEEDPAAGPEGPSQAASHQASHF